MQFSANDLKLATGDLYTPITVMFVIDENVKQSTRTVYTVSDALSATGGFLGII